MTRPLEYYPPRSMDRKVPPQLLPSAYRRSVRQTCPSLANLATKLCSRYCRACAALFSSPIVSPPHMYVPRPYRPYRAYLRSGRSISTCPLVRGLARMRISRPALTLRPTAHLPFPTHPSPSHRTSLPPGALPPPSSYMTDTIRLTLRLPSQH